MRIISIYEANRIARRDLGYKTATFLNKTDFDKVKHLSSKILKESHWRYLKTDEWVRNRFIILKRDKYKCRRCGKKATEVHHFSYENFGSPQEIKDCVSLCRNCNSGFNKKWWFR